MGTVSAKYCCPTGWVFSKLTTGEGGHGTTGGDQKKVAQELFDNIATMNDRRNHYRARVEELKAEIAAYLSKNPAAAHAADATLESLKVQLRGAAQILSMSESGVRTVQALQQKNEKNQVATELNASIQKVVDNMQTLLPTADPKKIRTAALKSAKTAQQLERTTHLQMDALASHDSLDTMDETSFDAEFEKLRNAAIEKQHPRQASMAATTTTTTAFSPASIAFDRLATSGAPTPASDRASLVSTDNLFTTVTQFRQHAMQHGARSF